MGKQNNAATPFSIVLPVLSAYMVLVGVGLHFHELWLDESQHFLIGRDSGSFSSLYWNMRYDGHPRLWNYMIFILTHSVSRSYVVMQVLHLVIAASAAFLLLRYSPFALEVKLLILLGYYFIFEFSVISRNYALGILLLFIVCMLIREPRRRLLWIGFLLFVMCNTHLFFAFASMGVFFYLLIEYRKGREWLSRRFALFTLQFMAGFVCIIIQTRVPQEENFHHTYPAEWLSGKNLSFAAFGVIRGWLPVPRVKEVMEGHFWNSYALSEYYVGPVFLVLLLAFFVLLPWVLWRRDIKTLVFYYVSFFFIWAFFIVTQQTATRYFGMVYIYFLAAWWMAGGNWGAVGPGLAKVVRVMLYGILFIQVGVGLLAYEQDIARPFSSSKDAVDFLKKKGLDSQAIVLDGYNGGPMISAYLGRELYCTTTGKEGSYVIWKTSYWPRPRPTIGQEIARSPYLQGLNSYVIVSTLKLDTGRIEVGDRAWRLSCLASFTGSVVKENFFIYQSKSSQ